jgi:methylenetetrahydrofolate reductase (NADPH)
VEIARRLAAEVKPFCNGIHIMAMGREELIPEIIKEVR